MRGNFKARLKAEQRRCPVGALDDQLDYLLMISGHRNLTAYRRNAQPKPHVSSGNGNGLAKGMGLIEKLRALGRPITARELGELLSVSKETILRKVKRGVYPSYREGNKILFNPLALVRHFESKGKR